MREEGEGKRKNVNRGSKKKGKLFTFAVDFWGCRSRQRQGTIGVRGR